MEKYTALDLLFEMSLRHLYQGEKAIAENLIIMADHASHPNLKELLIYHHGETEKQIERLEKIFNLFQIDPKKSKIFGLKGAQKKAQELLKTLVDMNFGNRSRGIDGILNEGHELLRHFSKTDANEFAISGAGQKIEHYEIACYNSLCLMGERYGEKRMIDLLKESLSEEIEMEKRLSKYSQKSLHALAS